MDLSLKKRSYYLDNLKVFLTMLVILHHTAIGFGGEGLFVMKYHETPSMLGVAILTSILAINQSFFMGMFFMISSYFTYKSAMKKSEKDFIKSKFKRLLIPAIIYFFIIAPLIQMMIKVFYNGMDIRLLSYDPDIGPLWFVLALFIFDIIYVCVKDKIVFINELLTKDKLIFIVFILSIITWAIRLLFPVGITIPIVSFQLAHFPQYIFAYYLGLNISRNDWLENLREKHIKSLWLIIPLIAIFLLGVGITYGIYGSPEKTMGGMNIVAFLYALWEQIMFCLMSLGLLATFKYRLNISSRLLRYMSNAAFRAYVVHYFVIVALMITISSFNLSFLVSFILTVLLSIVISFAADMV